MRLLTAEEVTNLFLYGTKTLPTNLEDGNLIRPPVLPIPTAEKVDINEYMNGPGRFASPAFFEVIKLFFSPTSSGLASGIYSKEDLYAIFGLNTIDDRIVAIQQSLYDDGQDNYLERAYIWESTAFQIDNHARFVVNADGSRYIQDFGIVPYSNNNNTEDFDFKSDSGFSKLVNFALEPLVDPSGIGRTVVIYFDGIRTLDDKFTYADYVNAASTAVQPNPLLVGTIIASALSFTEQLFESGSTRFLNDGNKSILYGTDRDDNLTASGVNLIDTPLLDKYKTNGVALVAGIGNDQLNGGDKSDKLYGGTGDDTLTGNGGNDYLEGGQGNDTYIYHAGDGFDTIQDSNGADKILWDGLEIKGSNTAGLAPTQWQQLSNTVWQDQANHLTYSLKTQVDASKTLFINKAGDELRVDHWVNGNLGITLGAGSVAPTPTHIYNGDQRAPLIGSEIDLTVPSTNPSYNTFKWSATSWAADGTLTGGVAQANFNDVIVGSSAADSINGLGGNDALSGGAGNDTLDGGAGNDLIAGGAGSDIIYGGAGNDMILSATGLSVPQRTGPGDVWQTPSGKTVWIKGSNWGVADGTNGDILNGGEGYDTYLIHKGDNNVLGKGCSASEAAWREAA